MGRCLRFLWRRGQGSLLVTLAFLPVPVLLTAYYAREFLPYVWVWPLVHVGLDVLGTVIRGKLRILYALFQVAVMAGLTFAMGFPPRNIQVCVPGVVYAALLLIELPLSAQERIAEQRVLKYAVIGGLLHSVGQFFLANEKRVGKTVLEPVGPLLTVGFVLLVAVALILLNEVSLASISQGRLVVGKGMRRKNLVFTFSLSALAAGAALLIGAVPGLKAVFRRILQWISRLVEKLESSGDLAELPPENVQPGVLEPISPNTTPLWLEKLITVIMIAVASAIVLGLLWILLRKLKVFFQLLGNGLQEYMQAVSEDYVDEITDIREEQKKRKKRRSVHAREMSPTGRIRYRYWQLMEKHPEWGGSSTARENLNPETAELYERVRYGGCQAEEADAKAFAERTRKL